MRPSVRQAHGAFLRPWHALLVSTLIFFGTPALPVESVQLAAQQRRVQGRVLEQVRGAPLPGAVITVSGVPRGARSDSAGRYTVTVPPGALIVRAVYPGYLPQTREITIPPGQTIALDFVLMRIDSQERRQHSVLEPPGDDTVPTERLQFSLPDTVLVRYRQLRYRPFTPRPGDTLHLPLFPDVDLLARSTRVVSAADGHIRWQGELLDEHGRGYGSVILVVRPNRLVGNIQLDDRVFEIRPYGRGIHVVLELDPRRFPPEPPPLPPVPPRGPPPLPTPWPPWLPPLRPSPWLIPALPGGGLLRGPASCSDVQDLVTFPEVRVLVTYSEAVATTPAPDAGSVAVVEDEIDIMLLQLEEALRTSGIPVQVVLAHSAKVAVEDLSTLSSTKQLARLTDPADNHADVVHAWRDQYHADLTVLLLEHVAGSEANTLTRVTLAHENAAFAVVKRATARAGLTFTHEVGHLLSAQHARWTGMTEGQPYHYNYGYVLTQPYHTVMAIKSGSTRLARFSNPDQAYQGEPLGVPSTQSDAADNRRAITNAASIVSAFRLTPVWFASLAGVGPWAARLATDDQLDQVRFGDFDGDGEADAFRVNLGTGTWEWSRSAAGPWTTLNNLVGGGTVVAVTELGFGDFDGDRRTDVFYSDMAAAKWLWSSGGSAAWATLNASIQPALPAAALAFADFDQDHKTDVFWSDVAGRIWRWSKGGVTPWADLQPQDPALAINVHDLGFADFDGDGASDVFRADPGQHAWLWSRSGTHPWEVLNANMSIGTHDLAFGDFDGDKAADVFTTDGTNWLVSYGAKDGWQIVRSSCHRLPQLRFGDFDGDGTTDVIRAGIRP